MRKSIWLTIPGYSQSITEGSHGGGSLRQLLTPRPQSREMNVSTLPACHSTHMTKELTSQRSLAADWQVWAVLSFLMRLGPPA